MTAKLWRINPRVSNFASLTEEFTREQDAAAWDEVSPDLFFGDEAVITPPPSSTSVFTMIGSGSAAFQSQTSVGPPGPTGLPLLSTEWFKRDDVLRIILVEIDYITQNGSGSGGTPQELTLYLANYAYFDNENSRPYRDCVRAVPRFNRALNKETLRGRAVTGIGSLEIYNPDGTFDFLLANAFDGSKIRFYMGDAGDVASARPEWLRSQFIHIFTALGVKVREGDNKLLSISLGDINALLKQQLSTDVTVGGSGPNANRIRDYSFGMVRQIEPVLKDAGSLTYAWHKNGTNAQLLDVRCKADAIAYTDAGGGDFRLLANPSGKIVCDLVSTRGTSDVAAVGLTATLGSYRISDAFYQIVGIEAGLATSGQYADRSANFEFQWTNDYHIGGSWTSGTKIEDIIDQLCDTGNCYTATRRDGLWTYGWMRPEALDFFLPANAPPGTNAISPVATIDDDDDLEPPKIDHADPGPYKVQAYGNVNWTEQSEFDATVASNPTLLDLYSRKGYSPAQYTGEEPSATTYLGAGASTYRGGAPQLYHKMMTTELDVRTLISCRSDADAAVHLMDFEAVRRAVRLPWLEFLTRVVDLSYYQVEIGNLVTNNSTRYSRFSLSNINYQVYAIDIALSERRITLGMVRRRPAVSTY